MPALMSKCSSAVLGELDRRTKFAAVAKGRIVKKSSAPSPIPNAPARGEVVQKLPVPIQRKPAGVALKNLSMSAAPAISYMQLGEAPKRCTAPKGRPSMIPCARRVSGVANGGIVKKSSAPSPIPNAPEGAVLQKSPAPIQRKPAGAAIKSTSLPMPKQPAQAGTKKSSAPISRTTPPLLPSSSASEFIKRGSTVRVRTRVGTLPTGLCLVLWLSAVVVSDVEDGYFKVIYNGDFPRDDPFRAVRVARDQVKSMPSQQ